jgi:hypothetical protein
MNVTEHIDIPYDDPKVPGLILAKIVNRRRRQLWFEKARAPSLFIEKEQRLINEAVDELSAWAEEHAPELFYRRKEGNE